MPATTIRIDENSEKCTSGCALVATDEDVNDSLNITLLRSGWLELWQIGTDYNAIRLVDWEVSPNYICGVCDEETITWGPNGERWQTSTRDDVSACQDTCASYDECLAFNFVESHGKCYFRRNDGTCDMSRNDDRDCYQKRELVVETGRKSQGLRRCFDALSRS